jgi:hypothetical protein
MRKHIEVEAKTGMNRKQVRLTNAVANTLVRKHAMCLDCAIKLAVAFVWGQSGKPTQFEPCSAVCGHAVLEFCEETFGKPEPVSPDELPWRGN